MTRNFRIRGLSKPHSVTLEHNNNAFWAESNLTQDRFDALFQYSKHDWDEPKFGVVEYVKQTDDGTPIDGLVIEVKL